MYSLSFSSLLRLGPKMIFLLLFLSPIIHRLSAGNLCLKGAIHVHSFRSHDSLGSFEEIRKAAIMADLDFVILTDHFPFERGGFEDAPADSQELVWIDGIEVPVENKKYLFVGLEKPLKGPWSLEASSQARTQGALVFASHLRHHREMAPFPIDGVEIYSLHEDFLSPFWRLPEIFYESLTLKEDKGRLRLALFDEPKKEIDVFYRIFEENKSWVWIAGNDAHQNLRFLARQIDPYEDSFGFVNTYVWASAKTEGAILKALSQGRNYIGFPWMAPAEGFIFQRDAGRLRARLPSGAVAKVRLYSGEKLIFEKEASGLNHKMRHPGIYRVEVLKKVQRRELPWIYSSPIYYEGE